MCLLDFGQCSANLMAVNGSTKSLTCILHSHRWERCSETTLSELLGNHFSSFAPCEHGGGQVVFWKGSP